MGARSEGQLSRQVPRFASTDGAPSAAQVLPPVLAPEQSEPASLVVEQNEEQVPVVPTKMQVLPGKQSLALLQVDPGALDPAGAHWAPVWGK